MSIHRQSRLKELIDSRFDGNQAAFAKAINKAPAQVHQWLSGYRKIGDGACSNIETSLNIPRGWMDNQSTQLVTTTSDQLNLNPRETALLGLFNGLTQSQQDDLLRTVAAQKQMNDALLGELLKRRG